MTTTDINKIAAEARTLLEGISKANAKHDTLVADRNARVKPLLEKVHHTLTVLKQPVEGVTSWNAWAQKAGWSKRNLNFILNGRPSQKKKESTGNSSSRSSFLKRIAEAKQKVGDIQRAYDAPFKPGEVKDSRVFDQIDPILAPVFKEFLKLIAPDGYEVNQGSHGQFFLLEAFENDPVVTHIKYSARKTQCMTRFINRKFKGMVFAKDGEEVTCPDCIAVRDKTLGEGTLKEARERALAKKAAEPTVTIKKLTVAGTKAALASFYADYKNNTPDTADKKPGRKWTTEYSWVLNEGIQAHPEWHAGIVKAEVARIERVIAATPREPRKAKPVTKKKTHALGTVVSDEIKWTICGKTMHMAKPGEIIIAEDEKKPTCKTCLNHRTYRFGKMARKNRAEQVERKQAQEVSETAPEEAHSGQHLEGDDYCDECFEHQQEQERFQQKWDVAYQAWFKRIQTLIDTWRNGRLREESKYREEFEAACEKFQKRLKREGLEDWKHNATFSACIHDARGRMEGAITDRNKSYPAQVTVVVKPSVEGAPGTKLRIEACKALSAAWSARLGKGKKVSKKVYKRISAGLDKYKEYHNSQMPTMPGRPENATVVTELSRTGSGSSMIESTSPEYDAWIAETQAVSQTPEYQAWLKERNAICELDIELTQRYDPVMESDLNGDDDDDPTGSYQEEL